MRLAENTKFAICAPAPSHNFVGAISSPIGKIVKQQYLLHMSSRYGELRRTSGWDRLVSLEHHNFNGFCVLASLLQQRHWPEANQTLHTNIYFFGDSCLLTQFCSVHNSRCVRVFRSILAALLHCIRAVGISQTLWYDRPGKPSQGMELQNFRSSSFSREGGSVYLFIYCMGKDQNEPVEMPGGPTTCRNMLLIDYSNLTVQSVTCSAVGLTVLSVTRSNDWQTACW